MLCLQNEGGGLYTGDGSVDCKGNPALKKNTGQWKACSFILGDMRSFTFALMCPIICSFRNSCSVCIYTMQVRSFVNGWPSMGFRPISSTISSTNCTKKPSLLQRVSLIGRELATLHPSSGQSLPIPIGEDIGQLPVSL